MRIKDAWLDECSGSAYLYWVSSPWRGDHGLMVTCVFRSPQEHKILYRPWGELPILKMGCLYQDGMFLSLKPDLRRFSFSSDQITGIEFQTVFDALKPSDYPLRKYSPACLYDQCLICRVGETNYTIPCVEIVRAVAGVSSFLVNQLLSASSLTDYADIGETAQTITVSPNKQGNVFPSATRLVAHRIRQFLLQPRYVCLVGGNPDRISCPRK